MQQVLMMPVSETMVAVVQDWIKQHKEKGVQPVISNPSREVMRLLEKAHIPQLIGDEYITVRVNDAVLLCKVPPRPQDPCLDSAQCSASCVLPAEV